MPISNSLGGFYDKTDRWLNKNLRLRRKANFKQFFMFCTVGATGTIINLIIFFLLVEIFHVNYLIAAVIAFVFAVTNNFILNKRWTFMDRGGSHVKKYLSFVLVSIVGLFINLLVLYSLVEFAALRHIIAQFIAVLTAAVSNFLLSKYLVFRA